MIGTKVTNNEISINNFFGFGIKNKFNSAKLNKYSRHLFTNNNWLVLYSYYLQNTQGIDYKRLIYTNLKFNI